MRMKEDHMRNGQLKPGYNLQISTEDQMLIGYSLHQTAVDSPTFKSHLNHVAAQLSIINHTLPPCQIADAVYGSEENYLYLEQENLEAYIKYNTYRIEQTRKWRLAPSKVNNLHYNQEGDFYICPMGQRMTFRYETTTRTTTGFESKNRIYRAQNCKSCPMRSACFKAKGERTISINPQLLRLKQKAKALLETEEGQAIYKQRSIDVEPTFGNIKWNAEFKRFYLRTLSKVNVEVGLLALAHNFKKWAKRLSLGPNLGLFYEKIVFNLAFLMPRRAN